MKNLKKIEILLVTLFMISVAFTKYSFATPDTNGKMLGLYDGDVGRPSGFYTTATSQSRREIPIIKIIEYNSTGSAPDTSKSKQAIYCLKYGVGFGSDTSSNETVKYTEYFDLKDPSSISRNIQNCITK